MLKGTELEPPVMLHRIAKMPGNASASVPARVESAPGASKASGKTSACDEIAASSTQQLRNRHEKAVDNQQRQAASRPESAGSRLLVTSSENDDCADQQSGSTHDGDVDPAPTADAATTTVGAATSTTTKHTAVPRTGRIKKRHWAIFSLGGLLGVLLAIFFVDNNAVSLLPNLDVMLDLPDLSALTDVLPANMLTDLRQFTSSRADERSAYDSFAVGLYLQSQGLRAKFPVVMIPGVISTGLESWGTDEASRPYFRKRLWGSWTMMRALVLDKQLWKRHLMLDKETGLDPAGTGVKLRAAAGFDATDFFITGYWIWNKVLENLATIGYDPTNAFSAPYDWRLSYLNLETRDQYFTLLKGRIEMIVRHTGRKLILTSHSMGSQVVMFFLKWVEHPDHGGGGRNWVNDYIDSWINISGCMLGTAKGLSAVLSGEMKDTAQLNSFALYGLEKFLSREDRLELFRAMPGVSSMLPKGGEEVWGNSTWAPDDLPDMQHRGSEYSTFGNMISFVAGNATATPPATSPLRNMTVEQSEAFLLNNSELWYQRHILSSYSHGVAHTRREVEENENDPRTWLNPLESRLPHAPDLKIYCFYGVGKPTERAYFYRSESQDDTSPTEAGAQREPHTGKRQPNIAIDTAVTSDDGMIDHGVVMSEGDGTVNLLSLGYMCAKGWRMKRYNPASVKVTVYEMPHEPDRFSPRGGPNTGDHVDILGRSSLNDLILRIAAGQGHLIEENYVSRIREIAERVKIYDGDYGAGHDASDDMDLLAQIRHLWLKLVGHIPNLQITPERSTCNLNYYRSSSLNRAPVANMPPPAVNKTPLHPHGVQPNRGRTALEEELAETAHIDYTHVSIIANPSVAALYEDALVHETGTAITSSGALTAYSGAKTGRSPSDKRIVQESSSEKDVWWGPVNKPMSPEVWRINRERAVDYLNTRKRIYVVDGFAGWDERYRIKVRVVCARAYHALFMRNMLIRPSREELVGFHPDYVIYNAGSFPANRWTEGMTSATSVAINFAEKEMVILGTEYAGEMKKGIFTVLFYEMPIKHNVLTLHSSANQGQDGDVTLFFGLSGTGKTTLSADPKRALIGDDEHCWSDKGVFNIEGGCYAKCVGLSAEKEPDIYNAIRFGSILENVVFDPVTRQVDYDDVTLTENTRCAYPIEYIENAKIPCQADEHPRNIILLTCDARGVLPPISKLTTEQMMFHFISGYTSKMAGTEVGVTEPQATFSTCFAQPFLALHPMRYASMLAEKMKEHKANAWLLNTGWVGAGATTGGKRCPLKYTRAILDAIHAGELAEAEYEVYPVFNLNVPKACPNVPEDLLNPVRSWTGNAPFEQEQIKLAELFNENFKKYADKATPEVLAAGPVVEKTV
ncbi:Protein kinase C-like 1 [Ascosphaera acerosa]|nr:Protein kinase C-like 1 [Ascosphaera acerosa]